MDCARGGKIMSRYFKANPEAAIDSKVIPLITAAMLKFSGGKFGTNV